MDFVNKLLKPDHDYLSLVFQILFIYFVYKVYLRIVVKVQNRQAYSVLIQDRPLATYEGSEFQKQDQQKVKQQVEQELKTSKNKQKQQDELNKKLQQEEDEKEKDRLALQQQNNVSLKELLKRNKHEKLLQGKDKSQKASQKVQHSTYLSAIKGFSGEITDFCMNSKYICAASQDKSIKVFSVSQFFTDPENPKFIFYNLNMGHPTALCVSQIHDRIYYGSLGQISSLTFKPAAVDHKYFQFEKVLQTKAHSDIKNIFVDSHDLFLITTGEDTFIKVWFMNGTQAKTINTSYGQHYHSVYNLQKNYLIVSSWSSDTSIFELKINNDKSFKSIEKVMLLRGEKGNVLDAQIDEKGCRASLVSKGIHLQRDQDYARFINTNVEYVRKEDTKILKTFTLQELQKSSPNQRDQISSAASFYVDKNKSLYIIGYQYDLLLFDNEFNQIENIPFAASGSLIKRIVLKEFKNGTVQSLLGFIWGDGDERINILDFTRYISD